MELLDIYNENEEKTGKIIERQKKELLADGEYIVGAQAIIINSKGQILISKRSGLKKVYPFKWECNGGAVLMGESSLHAVIREMNEELGLELSEKSAMFYKSIKKNKEFKDIWVFHKDIEIIDLFFLDGEVEEAKWVSIDQFEKMYDENKIVSNVDFDRIDYMECLRLLKTFN